MTPPGDFFVDVAVMAITEEDDRECRVHGVEKFDKLFHPTDETIRCHPAAFRCINPAAREADALTALLGDGGLLLHQEQWWQNEPICPHARHHSDLTLGPGCHF